MSINDQDVTIRAGWLLKTRSSDDIRHTTSWTKKILTDHKCLSVQAQDRYSVRTAKDQRGEQTLNRDAKTTGGIKGYASNKSSVMKWTLNRAEQAPNTDGLYNMCDIRTSSHFYKPSRPSQILQSESRVSNVVSVLK